MDRNPHLQRLAWALLSVAPIVLAVWQLGRLHPDEVYQYLEPAFLRVFGYGEKAWEWEVGLRNWAFPGLLSLLLRLCAALGITHPVAYRAVLAMPQLLLHAGALWALARFLERHAPESGDGAGPSSWAFTWAFIAVALQGSVLAYAGRTLGESLSVDLLWLALEALDRPVALPARASGHFSPAGMLGGVWLGLAVVARYPSATIVLGVLGALFLMRRQALALSALAGGALVALGLGALDWVTWGAPFHSFAAYVHFNVLSGEAGRRFGTSPFWVYGLPLLQAVPLWAWPAAWLARRRPESRPALMGAGVYTVALLFSAHREERFLYPLAQLVVFAAAPALPGLLRNAVGGAGRLWRGVGVAGALAASTATWLCVPDVRGEEFRAIVQATRDADARGLLIVGEGLWGSGGYFYLGKRIPWLTCDWPHDPAFRYAMRNRSYNRAVIFEGRARGDLQAAGFRVVDRIGREQILQRP